MSPQPERRYKISEVAEMTRVPTHVLRQWEERFPPLRPKRDRNQRRYYMPADIEIIRRIKQLVRHDKLTTKGAVRVLSQELHGEGRPKTNQQILELLDKSESKVRQLLDLMDKTDQHLKSKTQT